MHVDLYCSHCRCHFAATPLEANLWEDLGDGATFEDTLFHALGADGLPLCPLCARPVRVNEESLGQAALHLLGA